MKKRGFTLIELLVVIAIIALLMGILMPTLAKVKQIACRMICGTNLAGIGKAMALYGNVNEGDYPRAGGRAAKWAIGGVILDWKRPSEPEAFDEPPFNAATITSSFYYLIKYADMTPKQFICCGDKGASEFRVSDGRPVPPNPQEFELEDGWDFGGSNTAIPDTLPANYCSYSYHMPYGLYALTTSSEPGVAIAADRNPWLKSPAAEGKDAGLLRSYNPTGGKEAINIGNAIAHQEDGQNVLFMDSHVSFEKKPFCGVNDDNIYTWWDGGDIRRGGLPVISVSEPADRLDSLLVHGGEGEAPPKGRGCFLADTPVWVDGALMQIFKVNAGQTVGKVGCLATALQIEKLQEHQGTFECRDITLENGNRISVVAAHCFMLDSEKWIAAQNLQSGMRLKSLKGPIAIKSVVKRAMPFVGKVYNLKVKDGEQYLVGEDGVVVRDW